MGGGVAGLISRRPARTPAAAFELAARRVGADSFDISLAGAPARVLAAGEGVARTLMDAFATVRLPKPVARDEVRLEIRAWDRAAAEVDWPSPATAEWAESERQATRVLTAPGAHAAEFRESHWVSLLERGGSGEPDRITAAVDDAEAQTNMDRGRPLKAPLSVWHYWRGRLLAHAAMVVRDGRGLLIGGDEGAGKTTMLLGCIAAGWRYLGDDHVALSIAEGRGRGEGVYGFTALHEADLAGRPDLAGAAIPPPAGVSDKHLIRIAHLPGAEFAARATIDAIALPRVGARPGQISAASPGEAVAAMALTTMLMQPLPAGRRGSELLTAVADSAPALRAPIGVDGAGAAAAAEAAVARS